MWLPKRRGRRAHSTRESFAADGRSPQRLSMLGATVVVTMVAGLLLSGLAAAGSTCTIYWTGETSTNWSTNSNWSLTDGGVSAGRVPSSSDYVCMSTSASNIAVDLNSSTTSTIAGINWPQTGSLSPSLEVDDTLTIGSKTAVDSSTLNELDIQGTVVLYKGEVATSSSLTLTGTLEGPGKFTVSGPATLGSSSDEVFLGEYGASGTQADLVLQGATTVPSGTDVYFSCRGRTIRGLGR